MIELKRIFYEYNIFDETIEVLKDVNLTLSDKDVILVRGESGCGKSTLSKLICGIYKPSSGVIFYKGEKVSSGFLQTKTVCLNPKYYYINNLTVMDNLILCLDSYYSKKEIKNEILKTLDALGIKDKHFQKFKTLSSGEKQRVHIAYALLVKCEVLVLDEITQSLDRETALLCLKLLEDVRAHCLIYISHKEDVVAGITKKIQFENKQVMVTKISEVADMFEYEETVSGSAHYFSRVKYWIKAFHKLFILEVLFIITMITFILVSLCNDSKKYYIASHEYLYQNLRFGSSLFNIEIENVPMDFDCTSINGGYDLNQYRLLYASGHGHGFFIEPRTSYPESVIYGREIEAPGEVVLLLHESEFATFTDYVGRTIYMLDTTPLFQSIVRKEFPLKVVGLCVSNTYRRRLLAAENSLPIFNEFIHKYGIGSLVSQHGNSYFKLNDITIDNTLGDFILRQSIDRHNPNKVGIYRYSLNTVSIQTIFDDSKYGIFMNQATYDTLFSVKPGNRPLTLSFDTFENYSAMKQQLDALGIKYNETAFDYRVPSSVLDVIKMSGIICVLLIIVQVMYVRRNQFLNFIKCKRKKCIQ